MTIDEKWVLVKDFYERSYQQWKFKVKPDEDQIQYLYACMWDLSRSIREHYNNNPYLEHRLTYHRGHQRETEKRKPYQ